MLDKNKQSIWLVLQIFKESPGGFPGTRSETKSVIGHWVHTATRVSRVEEMRNRKKKNRAEETTTKKRVKYST